MLRIVLALTSYFAVQTAAAQLVNGYTTGADRIRIHYLQAGPAEAARTLLLVPGWRISASIWSKQLESFSTRKYRVVAIDSRSQGKSELSRANSPEDRAGDLQAVITGLRLRHLTLLGWSQGAQDVAAYVGKYGDQALEALVLVDTAVSSGPASVAERPVFVRRVLEGIESYARDPRGYTEGMLRAIITSPELPRLVGPLAEEASHTPTDVGISMLVQDMLSVDRRADLKRVSRPVLVVASASSPELDAQTNMSKTLSNGRLVVIDHAGHAVFFDQPEEFDRALDAFIDQVSKEGR